MLFLTRVSVLTFLLIMYYILLLIWKSHSFWWITGHCTYYIVGCWIFLYSNIFGFILDSVKLLKNYLVLWILLLRYFFLEYSGVQPTVDHFPFLYNTILSTVPNIPWMNFSSVASGNKYCSSLCECWPSLPLILMSYSCLSLGQIFKHTVWYYSGECSEGALCRSPEFFLQLSFLQYFCVSLPWFSAPFPQLRESLEFLLPARCIASFL